MKTNIILVAEDALTISAGRAIIKKCNPESIIYNEINTKGCGNLKKKMPAINIAAAMQPFIVITDLDNNNSAEELIQTLSNPKPNNLVFGIAIKEVESWILADKASISEYLGIPSSKIPTNTDEILDPKQVIVNLAKKGKKAIREGITPATSSKLKTGPIYNDLLSDYLDNYWNPTIGSENSRSLEESMARIGNFINQ